MKNMNKFYILVVVIAFAGTAWGIHHLNADIAPWENIPIGQVPFSVIKEWAGMMFGIILGFIAINRR